MIFKEFLRSQSDWERWRDSLPFAASGWTAPPTFPCVGITYTPPDAETGAEDDYFFPGDILFKMGGWEGRLTPEEKAAEPPEPVVTKLETNDRQMALTGRELGKLQVFQCHGLWHDPRNPGAHKQVDFYIASPSKAAIIRHWPELKNAKWRVARHEEAVKIATETPGALFASPLYSHPARYFELGEGSMVRS